MKILIRDIDKQKDFIYGDIVNPSALPLSLFHFQTFWHREINNNQRNTGESLSIFRYIWTVKIPKTLLTLN